MGVVLGLDKIMYKFGVLVEVVWFRGGEGFYCKSRSYGVVK